MPASRRLRRVIAAMSIAVAAYAAWFGIFHAIALRAERSGYVYPYTRGDIHLRYLLPSLMTSGDRPMIMIFGSSTAFEALQYERLQDAFPQYRLSVGAFPNATMDDVLLALDYLERAYGPQGIPKVAIIGVDARTLANKPRRFGAFKDRLNPRDPSLGAFLDLFSPSFRVVQSAQGSILVEKTRTERMLALWRFWSAEQQPRHRAAIAGAVSRLLNGPGAQLNEADDLIGFEDPRDLLNPVTIHTSVRYVASRGLIAATRRVAAAFMSPYDARFQYAVGPSLDPDSEFGVRLWNPDADHELINAQFKRLKTFAARHGMMTLLVHLPERPEHRAAHPVRFYDSLIGAVRRASDSMPVLDLRMRLGVDGFIDNHVNREGGRQTTEAVIAALKALFGRLPG